MDHLVVGQGQDEVLVEAVHHGEGQQVVGPRPEGEVGLHIVEGVVHPPHVPLVVEAQAPVLRRAGHQGPGGALLGHHHHVGEDLPHGLVELAEEGAGVQVLLGALVVEPFLGGVVDAEVQVEHAGDPVHPDAVDVVDVQPEHGVGEEEAPHLPPAQVEFIGAPLGVVLFLVELFPAEGGQAVGVPAEVAGDPVQDDPQARLVAPVDEGHEPGGVAVAGGGGVVAGDLVAPGPVEGVLHDGEELQVGVAHVHGVGDEGVGQLVIAVVAAVLIPPPGAQMDLVDVQGAGHVILAGPLAEPLGVLPGVVLQVPQPGGGLRGLLGPEGEGVGLVQQIPALGLDDVLIGVPGLGAGYKQMPYSRQGGGEHDIFFRVPIAELARHPDRLRPWGPDREAVALLAVDHGLVGAEAGIGLLPGAFREEIAFVFCQKCLCHSCQLPWSRMVPLWDRPRGAGR